MRQVIKSDAKPGDGVSIEREQPSTALRSMPQLTTWNFRVASPAASELIRLDVGPVNKREPLQDALTSQGDSTWFLQPRYRSGQITYREDGANRANPTPHPGINPDSMWPVELGSPEAHGGDSITGELNEFQGAHTLSWRDVRDHNYSKFAVDPDIWTTGGRSTFEDRSLVDYDTNDAVFCMKENIDWTAASGGPGSSYLTETAAPLPGMHSFGECLNSAAELGTHWCPGGPPAMTNKIGGNFGQMYSPLSSSDGFAF